MTGVRIETFWISTTLPSTLMAEFTLHLQTDALMHVQPEIILNLKILEQEEVQSTSWRTVLVFMSIKGI